MNPCIVCSQNNWLPLFSKLLRCKYCGFIKAQDKYFKYNPSKLYDDSYFNGTDYMDYENEKIALRKNFLNRIARIKKCKTKGKLLDIGCAFGYFMEVAKENGFKVEGVEINRAIAKQTQKQTGIKIYAGDLLKLRIASSKYDVITMLDTIEHFQNPHLYIQKAYRLLKKNGILIIETGNIDSTLAKLQKSKWRLITPPTHLHYFSPTTLSLLLTRSNYKLLEISTVGFYRTIGQTIYRLTRNKNIIHALSPILNKTYVLNTFDLMFIIAQK